MARNRIKIYTTFLASVIVLLVAFADRLPAGFQSPDIYSTIEIEGVDFGRVDKVSGLDTVPLLQIDKENYDYQRFGRITLHRDFVTSPSLYLWAKNASNRRLGLKDIHIVGRNQNGYEISRKVLHLCQPMSWTVEAASQGVGGFHESIEFAVRNLSAH